MTVKELTEKLSEYGDDLEVVIRIYDEGTDDSIEVEPNFVDTEQTPDRGLVVVIC
jgi:hypothetical protein